MYIFYIFVFLLLIWVIFYKDYLRSLFNSKHLYLNKMIKKLKSQKFYLMEDEEIPDMVKKIVNEFIFNLNIPVYGVFFKNRTYFILVLYIELEKIENQKHFDFFRKKIKNLIYDQNIKILLSNDLKKNIISNNSEDIENYFLFI